MNEQSLPEVVHRPELGRFELTVDGGLCIAAYSLRGDVMLMTHTEVPHPLEGRGLAARVVAAALAHARASGLKVRPLCSYVQSYMKRHPESQDLLDRG